jgi:glyoxylase-like metal-dependent hydrolase (beta-lactamase superfamily II)
MRHVPADAKRPAELPRHFRLGHFDLLVVNDGSYTVPAPFVAANAPLDQLAQELEALGQPMDAYRATINNLLINTGEHLVLVDAGFGAAGQADFPDTGKLLPALATQGIAPTDIDIVIVTHLHGDHVDGALDPLGKLNFPRARHVINREERAFWWAEPDLAEMLLPDEVRQSFRDGAKERLTALGAALEHVEPDAEVAPGVRLIAAGGHTPGHVAVEVTSAGETLLHIVDAAADPVLHLRHPDWVLASDTLPELAVRTRRQLFERAANERLLVLGYHFPFPGLGHARSAGDGWVWERSEP